MQLPTIALAIKQPWASLIIHGGKDIENRSWYTHRRGSILIHASLSLQLPELANAGELIAERGIKLPPEYRELYMGRKADNKFPLGGIIGMADIVDCVDHSDSPWFVGEFGFVLANPRPLPFHPVRGQLGFFQVEYPQSLLG